MIAVKKDAATVVDTGGGRVESILEKARRVVQVWVKSEGSLQILEVWHSEQRTTRNFALFGICSQTPTPTRTFSAFLLSDTS